MHRSTRWLPIVFALYCAWSPMPPAFLLPGGAPVEALEARVSLWLVLRLVAIGAGLCVAYFGRRELLADIRAALTWLRSPLPDPGPEHIGRRVFVALAALVLCAGFTGRAAVVWQRAVPVVDECYSIDRISGLTVRPPAGLTDRWTTAGEWSRVLHSREATASDVARALREADIHPPLYYAAVNLWQRAIGRWSIRAASSFGLVLFPLGSAFLALLCRALRLSRVSSLLVLAAWSLGVPLVDVSTQVRHYAAAVALVAALAWSLIRLAEDRRPLRPVVVCLFSFACAATWYPLAAIACGLAASLFAVREYRAGAARALVAAGIGAGLALALFLRPDAAAGVASASDVVLDRPLSRALFGIAKLFLVSEKDGAARTVLGSRDVWSAAAMLVVCLVFLAMVRTWFNTRGRFVVCGALIAAAVVVLPWAAGIYPIHAMGPKYFAPAFPFIVVAAGFALDGLRSRSRVALVAVLCALFTAQFVADTGKLAGWIERESRATARSVAGCERVVIVPHWWEVDAYAVDLLPADMPVYVVSAGPVPDSSPGCVIFGPGVATNGRIAVGNERDSAPADP